MEVLSWLVELKDKLTEPVRKMRHELGGMSDDLSKGEKDTDKLGQSIGELERDLAKFKAARKSSFSSSEVIKFNNLIEETEKKLQDLEGLPKNTKQTWSDMATGLNQSLELVDKLSNALDFSQEYNQLKVDAQRFTDLTGKELDDLTDKVYNLSEVYGDSGKDIIAAANAMTDQNGGTLDENLAIIKAGYDKGGNLNDDMLQQLREYGTQMAAVGLDNAQTMAVIAQSNKLGIYDDKALDAIKEGGLSLREMGKTQIDALKGIGVKPEDLDGLNTFDAMKYIATKMQGSDTQAQQLIMADIFKGAGEDAGAGFINGLASMDLDINNIDSVQEAGAGMRSFFADVKSGIAGAVGSAPQFLSGFAEMATGIMATTQAYKTFSIAQKVGAMWTGIVTAATWAWGIALNVGLWPITLIVAGLAALTAGLVWAYNEFEGFRMVVDTVIESIMAAVHWVGELFGLMDDGSTAEVTVNENRNVEETSEKTGNELDYRNVINPGSKSSSVKKSKGSSGVGFASAEKKTINVQIDKLVESINIKTTNIKESSNEIKALITQTLIDSVRDAEVAI